MMRIVRVAQNIVHFTSWRIVKLVHCDTNLNSSAHFHVNIQMNQILYILMKWINSNNSVCIELLLSVIHVSTYCQKCYWWPTHSMSNEYVNTFISCLKARSVLKSMVKEES